MNNNNKKVYVGMSGGVDSSVSAYILKKAGYDVTGVFIKVWQPPHIECTWKEDRLDAMRVAAQLDIPFVTLDLEQEYKKDVIDYMVSEYSIGRVPNPDVMCNKYVKFGGFLEYAMTQGADYIATGHYTQTLYNSQTNKYQIHTATDHEKDQSYFLWTLPQEKLSRVLFPIGGMLKSEVRKIAHEAGLYTADKKDSQGLCFIGKLDLKEFLKEYITTSPGNVLNTQGAVIGTHEGALLYTLGERHGFIIQKKTPQDQPLFVVSKDCSANTITVSDVIEQLESTQKLSITSCNWVGEKPEPSISYGIMVRYRGEMLPATCIESTKDSAEFTVETKSILGAPGQSAVIYTQDILIGGGVIQAV